MFRVGPNKILGTAEDKVFENSLLPIGSDFLPTRPFRESDIEVDHRDRSSMDDTIVQSRGETMLEGMHVSLNLATQKPRR